jgi:hypothetical protein
MNLRQYLSPLNDSNITAIIVVLLVIFHYYDFQDMWYEISDCKCNTIGHYDRLWLAVPFISTHFSTDTLTSP